MIVIEPYRHFLFFTSVAVGSRYDGFPSSVATVLPARTIDPTRSASMCPFGSRHSRGGGAKGFASVSACSIVTGEHGYALKFRTQSSKSRRVRATSEPAIATS